MKSPCGIWKLVIDASLYGPAAHRLFQNCRSGFFLFLLLFCSWSRTISASMLWINTVTYLCGLASLPPGTCPGIYFGTVIVLLSKLNSFCKTAVQPKSSLVSSTARGMYPVIFSQNLSASQAWKGFSEAKIHGMASCTYFYLQRLGMWVLHKHLFFHTFLL